jgi:glucose/arabinose dehydrogenase
MKSATRILTSVIAFVAMLCFSSAWAQTLPANFTSSLVINVPSPTAIAFLPDKRMLITSQQGTVRLYDPTKPAGARLTTALTFDTNDSGTDPKTCVVSEAGVLGVAVDPEFTTNSFVYIFYTARNGSDCGSPNYGTTYNAANQRVNRVSRFTFNTTSNTITANTEVILVDRMPARGGNHNAGDVHFGKDGFLYISIGDGGTNWTGSGDAGANNAARDKNILTGKILRVTRDGGIPAGNPFQGAGTGVCRINGTHAGTDHCRETYAWGLRNPFRIAMDPNAASTRFFINDVGQGSREEISLSQSGADYGWNCREGSVSNSTTGKCSPTPPNMVGPYFDYGRTAGGGGLTVGDCRSITGGAVVPDGVWPSTWNGQYLFADYVCGGIFSISATVAPGPGSSSVQAANFATSLGNSSATSLRFGPDGNATALYYTSYVGSNDGVYKIVYTGSGNQAPTVSNLTASPASSANAPLTTTLTATASDPESGVLSYIWDFGDGSPTLTTTTNSTSKTYNTAGVYTASVKARDPAGLESSALTVVVRVGNTPPTAQIVAPVSGKTYVVGETITLTGSATDAQDASFPNSAYSWRVILHHDTHTHPFVNSTPGNGISFVTPAPEDLSAATNSYLEIELTVTDSGGLTSVVTRDIQPIKRTLTLQSSPTGRKIEVNGGVFTTPSNITVWPNWGLNVKARDQNQGGSGYRFSSWTDGGAQAKTYTTQNANATLTANFTQGSFVPSIDVDNNNALEASTDGVLLLRYLLGFRDAPLIAGNAVGANAERNSASAIASYLDQVVASLNVDGRAGVTAQTDGLIVLRYLLGISGAPLTAGTGATITPTQAQNTIQTLQP